MFARLLRAPKSETNRPRNTFRLRCEQFEDRSVPAVTVYTLDTTADTEFDHFDNVTKMAPVDANGDVSLRAVIEWATLNPKTGQDAYAPDFSLIASQTITLDPNLGALKLTSNFQFFGEGVTVERSTAPGVANFRLFRIEQVTVGPNAGNSVQVLFNSMTLQGGHTVFGGSGGAILIDRPATGSNALGIQSCVLTNNYASALGGAIAVTGGEGAGPTISISDSQLMSNTAVVAGGAIATQGAVSLQIDDSSIYSNEVTGTAPQQGIGGGLYIVSTVTLIQNTQVNENYAASDGGGLYFEDTDSLGGLTVNGGTFNGNLSNHNGGGFYIDTPGDTVTFTDVTITGANSASNKGGGGYVNNGTLDGSLAELTGNEDVNGVNGATAGIAFKQANGASAPITVPPNEQTVVAD